MQLAPRFKHGQASLQHLRPQYCTSARPSTSITLLPSLNLGAHYTHTYTYTSRPIAPRHLPRAIANNDANDEFRTSALVMSRGRGIWSQERPAGHIHCWKRPSVGRHDSSEHTRGREPMDRMSTWRAWCAIHRNGSNSAPRSSLPSCRQPTTSASNRPHLLLHDREVEHLPLLEPPAPAPMIVITFLVATTSPRLNTLATAI